MSSELEELFKSELGGDTEATLTKCIHCEAELTKSDLVKGLGTHFVKDDNNQPHSGGKGQVPCPRAGAAAKENDPVAPLLKGEKHGDGEQFVISKSEMEAMGLNVDDVEAGEDYIITKGELVRCNAGEHVDYLRHKTSLLKACPPEMDEADAEGEDDKPDLQKMKKMKKANTVAKSTHVGPQGVAAGVAVNPQGNPLIQWQNTGEDEAIAKAIETGSLGQGSDEPIKTRGSGLQ